MSFKLFIKHGVQNLFLLLIYLISYFFFYWCLMTVIFGKKEKKFRNPCWDIYFITQVIGRTIMFLYMPKGLVTLTIVETYGSNPLFIMDFYTVSLYLNQKPACVWLCSRNIVCITPGLGQKWFKTCAGVTQSQRISVSSSRAALDSAGLIMTNTAWNIDAGLQI